uniref:Uncharacterized protein n=1 Tax=Kalanchoe fedtschenkoi TaxID=63787 RepID=A0A7N0VMY2_KALFE
MQKMAKTESCRVCVPSAGERASSWASYEKTQSPQSRTDCSMQIRGWRQRIWAHRSSSDIGHQIETQK